eukprot:6190917-Pleurochrysis_carterae.AAC.3
MLRRQAVGAGDAACGAAAAAPDAALLRRAAENVPKAAEGESRTFAPGSGREDCESLAPIRAHGFAQVVAHLGYHGYLPFTQRSRQCVQMSSVPCMHPALRLGVDASRVSPVGGVSMRWRIDTHTPSHVELCGCGIVAGAAR